MPLEPGSRLGPYEILSPLGAGGMGEVFKARDTRLGRSVAIKVLPRAVADDDRFRTRFEREAKAISQLSHPHICTLHDIGHENGTSYLVMELLEGETLADRIARGPLPLRDVLRYGAEIAAALERAHRAGLVHRDLKPGNVMLTKNGAKLLDFGLARPARSPLSISATAPTAQQPLTAEGTIVGTLPYMPPEQVRGEEVDARTDIYALGVMLYEMTTGERPFKATNSVSLIGQILEQPVPRISDAHRLTPPAFEHIVRTCLEKDPDLRFQCAADVGHELRWLAAGGSDVAPVVLRDRARWPWYAAALATVLASIAGLFFAYRASARKQSRPPSLTFAQLTFDRGEESHPAISPDGKFVAFVKQVNGQKDIFLQRIDGRSAINLTASNTTDDDAPAFSPDGDQIAFRSERDGGGIFVMGATGESPRRITSKGFDPSWSPDGKELVFSEERTVDPRAVFGIRNLDVVDVATGSLRVVLDDGDIMQPAWSPHGDRIAFWSVKRGTRDIYTIDRSGRRETITQITADASVDWNPIWSPDGDWLYFLSDRDGTMNLWRVAIDEKSGRTSGALEPMRTPSSEVAFASMARHDPRLVFQSSSSYGELLRISIDPAGKLTPATVLSGSMILRYPSLSPDRQWIAFSSFTGQEDIYAMRVDGGEVRQLTNDAARDRGVGWWPDSSRIVFYSNRSGEFDAWSIRPDGSDLTRLSAIPGGITFPRISPDLRSMVYLPDSGERAAIADVSGTLPVKTAEGLSGKEAERFVPYGWSPDGRKIVGGVYGAYGVEVYSLDTKRFSMLDPGGRAAQCFVNGDEVLFVSRDYHVISKSLTTGKIRDFGSLPVDGNFRPASFAALHVSPRDVLFFRVRAESDIWQMRLSQ